jgi:membrane-bound lytic murein transglycosylase D
VQSELRERRLPEDLIWVAMIESGFDPRAQSPAGAVGLWQFMPATGEVYGLVQNHHVDQRKNPRLATQAAAHHLRDLYLRFGDWDLALAAYNMGYEQLLDSIDRYGTTDFNELSRQEAIPAETAAYVPKIAAAAIVANNLERFGFDRVDVVRPVDAAEIPVPPGTPLKTLAKAAGVSTSAVRSLNPDVLGDRVPPGRGDYMLLIPADTLGRAQAALPALLDTEAVVMDDASVLDPVDLMAGRASVRRRIHDEDKSLLSLLPPPKHRRSMREPIDDLDSDDDGDDFATRPRASRKRGRETVMYKVSEGDTLIGVARQFAMDVEDVARENHIDVDEKLKAGAMLKLKVRRDVLDTGSREADVRKDAPDKREEPKEKSPDRDADEKPLRHHKERELKEPKESKGPRHSARSSRAPT